MKSIRFAAVAAMLSLCANAWAAKPVEQPIPLGEQFPVELVLNQQEVGVDVSATNAMAAGGGLLGALIVAGVDNARTKAAEQRIIPIRDLLVAYPFNEAFQQQARAKLPSEGISPAPRFVVRDTALGAIDAQNNLDVAPRALLLTPRYAFDNKFSQMTVRLVAQVMERTPKDNGKLKTVVSFNRTYGFAFPLAQASDEPDANVKAWTDMGGEALVSMLDEGLRQTVDMLVFDFSPAGRSQWSSYDRRASVKLGGNTYPGIAVRETPEWVWARSGKNYLQALNGYRVAGGIAAAIEQPVPPPGDAAPVPAANAAQAQPADAVPPAPIESGTR